MSRHPIPWDPTQDPDAPARGFNPPQTHRLWRDVLLPRTVNLLFAVYWVLLLPAGLFRRSRRGRPTQVAIESGLVGWTHVYFEELWASAAEYVGDEARLTRVAIDRDQPYLPQFRGWSDDERLTHAVLDVRTGAQTWGRALVDVLAMSWRLRRRRITAVVVLTDASLRRHRWAAAVLTAFDGAVVTFMSAPLVDPMFPHRRLIGPLPMPVSVSRLRSLEQVRASVPVGERPRVAFIGGMYAPRSYFLDQVSAGLADRGIELEVHANKYQTSNDDYWRVLATSDVIITTTLQGMPRPDMDWIWIQQLVFRFCEALAAGAVLAAPAVAGGDRWFEPGRDFAPFVSVDDAVATLQALVNNADLREGYRAAGHETAVRLVEEHAFWRTIDQTLGAGAMMRPAP